MGSDAPAMDYGSVRERLLQSTELSELAHVSCDPKGNLLVVPRNSDAEKLYIVFKDYIELHSDLGYMQDFFSVDGNFDLDSTCEKVVQTLMELMRGVLIYTYMLDSQGMQIGGGIIKRNELQDYTELGYKTLSLG